jgi:hypothetical protein
MVPPAGVNLMALRTKFISTCLKRAMLSGYVSKSATGMLIHYLVTKIAFAIIICTPSLPSTSSVMWRSAATLASM